MSEQDVPVDGVQPAVQIVQRPEGQGVLRQVMLGTAGTFLLELEEDDAGEPRIVLDVPGGPSRSDLVAMFEYLAAVLEHGTVEGGEQGA